MTLFELYEKLKTKFGSRADPDTWWPIYFGRTVPPAFERAITNVLVTRSRWPVVRRAVEALDGKGLLTAKGLSEAKEEVIAECAKPTGFQKDKATTLKLLGEHVVSRYQTEAAFCAGVTSSDQLKIRGIGPETADRILLYTCGKLVWPVDTYCLRVLARHQVISALPEKWSAPQKRQTVSSIKQMVETQIPRTIDDWQRLHALMQLEGEDMLGR